MNFSDIWPDWVIEKEIGKGSFGKVYRIRKGSGQSAIYSALKIMSIPSSEDVIDEYIGQGMDLNSIRRLFEAEAGHVENEIKIMISMKSSVNVVSIEDYKIVQNGIGWIFYIRMELLESVNAYVKRKQGISEREIVKLGIDISNALISCERSGIIHRDVKPANIFRNEYGDFKLGDFGIAKDISDQSYASTRIGTPFYEAPEMIKGGKYNNSVDTYALGIILYSYTNHGRKPYFPAYPAPVGNNAVSESYEKRINGYPLDPPSEAPEPLAQIILKACAYDPSRRYESASDMREDLIAFSRGEAIHIPPDPVPPGPTPDPTPYRSLIIGLCAVGFIFLGLIVYFFPGSPVRQWIHHDGGTGNIPLYNSEFYPDGKNVTFETASYNESVPDWTEYDELIAEIQSEADAGVRLSKMHEAEDLLMASGTVIPICYSSDFYLQSPDVQGIYSDVLGFKYFQYAACPGGVLNAAPGGEPASLDPALNYYFDREFMIVNLFSGLYTYVADGSLQPDLADHENPYDVSDDGLVYTFHLQKGLKWSDGSDLTANDFVYTWQRAVDPAVNAAYAYMFEGIAGYDEHNLQIEASDDFTLSVTLDTPCTYFPSLTAFPAYFPVPPSRVEATPDWRTNPGAWASEAGFVTSGAYTVSEWNHSESMVLTRNPYYCRADAVTIREIDFMLSADEREVYEAYQSGNLDFSDIVPDSEIASLRGSSEFHTSDRLGTCYAAFNANSRLFDGKSADQAIALRKAFALLIDREAIVKGTTHRGQKTATSYIPQGMADSNGGIFKENTDKYTFPYEATAGYYPSERSPEVIKEARALLEYAGYVFTDAGVLSAENPISITCLISEDAEDIEIAGVIRQNLAELGITLSVEKISLDSFFEKTETGQFDLALDECPTNYDDPFNMLRMWTSHSVGNITRLGKNT